MSTFVPTFPIFPTLKDAIAKTRRITGSDNAFQITDRYIVQQMNSFYSYDLPAKFRSLKLKDFYTFTTNVGQDTYSFNSELYTTVDMPCYCAKREIRLFNNPWNFYGVNYNWQQINQIASGNGTQGPYSGNTTAFPFIASVNNDPGPIDNQNLYFPQSRLQNILITANVIGTNGIGETQNVTDDGNGNLIQIFQTSNSTNQLFGWTYYRQYAAVDPTVSGTATINYQTGEISGLYFNQVIPEGAPITVQYNPKKLSIPLSLLFYQNQIVVAPVPDRGYTIEMTAYRQPIKALLAADHEQVAALRATVAKHPGWDNTAGRKEQIAHLLEEMQPLDAEVVKLHDEIAARIGKIDDSDLAWLEGGQ
jgi:hypothetical protein